MPKRSSLLHFLAIAALLSTVACTTTSAQSAAPRENLVSDWVEYAASLRPEWAARTPATARTEGTTALAMFEAANAVEQTYPPFLGSMSAPGNPSERAAVASAAHDVLVTLYPDRRAGHDARLQRLLRTVPDGPGEQAGLVLGAAAARAAIARAGLDPTRVLEPYRTIGPPGLYVPTEITPVISEFDLALLPWALEQADEFRAGGPPPLASARYARDLDEVRRLGAREGSERTSEQTQSARFWFLMDMNPTLREIASRPGWGLARNARLYTMFYMASDDAWIASSDTKNHYRFWRPITAIRNAERDGNEATDRVADWLPLMPTPMHPEYPCAHCIIAAAQAVILDAEGANPPEGGWAFTSTFVPGVTRRVSSFQQYVQETAMSRIYAGAHYRFSNEDGVSLGRAVGAKVLSRFGLATPPSR